MAFGIDSDKVFCTVDVILGSVTTTGFEPFSGKVIGTGFDASRCNTWGFFGVDTVFDLGEKYNFIWYS